MRILTADIGGTNTRLGIFSSDNSIFCLEKVQWYSSSCTKGLEGIFEQFQSEFSALCENIHIFSIAAAGIKMTPNFLQPSQLPWSVDLDKLKAFIPTIPNFFLFNDFEAQAYACATSISNDFIPLYIGKSTKHLEYPMGIIGAGTGLGYGFLQEHRNEILFFPSEAGHQNFAFYPQSSFEQEFCSFLCQEKNIPYAIGDDVLSGSGLAYLHYFLTKEKLEAHALPENSPAFAYFSSWYGRTVRNMALTFLPQTIVISGGIGAKRQKIFNSLFFQEYFLSTFSAYLKKTNIFLNINQNSALYGSAFGALKSMNTANICFK